MTRRYARVLVDQAHAQGFKVLVATRGAEALALAREYQPTAVSLDVFLPDMLGWTVLNQLKQDPRYAPHSRADRHARRRSSARSGARRVLVPAEADDDRGARVGADPHQGHSPRRARKRLLVVEDNAAERLSITALLGHDDIEIDSASTGGAALATLRERPYDCAVLDLRLPDMSGFEVLEHIRDDVALCDLPVVVFTGKELSSEEDARLRMLARSVVVKGRRIAGATARRNGAVPPSRGVEPAGREAANARTPASRRDDDLVGKKVLVVDDDVRNIFALSSVLERRGMKVLTAGTGHEAIATLGQHARRGHRADGHHDA